MQDFPCLGKKKRMQKQKKKLTQRRTEQPYQDLPVGCIQPCAASTQFAFTRDKKVPLASFLSLFSLLLLFTDSTEHLSCVSMFPQPQEERTLMDFRCDLQIRDKSKASLISV